RGPARRSRRRRARSRIHLDLEPHIQARPTDVRRHSRPDFRTPAYWTRGRVCVCPPCAFGVFRKASRLTRAGGPVRVQPRRRGGAEGSGLAARLHQRVYRTGQGFGIGAAGHRARWIARTPDGTGKNKLRSFTRLLLEDRRQLSRQKQRRWRDDRFGSIPPDGYASRGRAMSALPPKADIRDLCRHVGFVPKADVSAHLQTELLLKNLASSLLSSLL